MNKENKCIGDLDYEAEYLRLKEIVDQHKCEVEYWKTQYMEAERMRENLRFVIRTIEVIFGREFGA